MIIPPIRWGDIILRSETERSVRLTEREQYTLMMLLSLTQMNSEQFISDYTIPDSEDIHQFLDETINSLLDETIPPFESYGMYPINAFIRNFDKVSGTWTKSNTDFMTFRHIFSNTNAANGHMEQKIFLTPGDWKFRVLYAKATNGGVWHIKLNDQLSFQYIAASLDLNGLFNAEFTLDTTLTVERSEEHEIEIFNQGTTTSGGHTGHFQSVHFWKV